MMEALACHPLDTIKVRMQLSKRARMPGAPKRGFIKTGSEIIKRETALGLYKGLGAVLTGIVPKMAIRFTSYEFYKQMLADKDGIVTSKSTFLAGLSAGVTEAVCVVTPMEVIKIRLQAQHHSMADPLDVPKYRNAAHALYTVVKEEGAGTVARCVAHSTASGYKPGCKLHNLLRVEVAAAGLSWHNGPARVADILHWSDLWCYGTLFERAH